MAKAASKATTVTTLVIGQVKIPIGLYSSADKPGSLVKFDTAGPNGGELLADLRARPTPVAETVEQPSEPVHSDPLGDPGRDTPVEIEAPATHMLAGASRTVPGEYGRALVEKGTGEVVPPENIRRGVRLENGEFVDCTAQLVAIEASTKLETVEIVAFVSVSQVERARVKGAMFVGAGDEQAPKALRLIFEALKATRRVGVVKVTKRSRQTLGVIGWLGKSLMLYELVWAEDFRPPPRQALAIQQAEISTAELNMAVELVQAMSDRVATLDELRDDALEQRELLYEQALAGKVPAAEVVDAEVIEPADELLSQLQASLAVA